jgi:hypothetical protein
MMVLIIVVLLIGMVEFWAVMLINSSEEES